MKYYSELYEHPCTAQCEKHLWIPYNVKSIVCSTKKASIIDNDIDYDVCLTPVY